MLWVTVTRRGTVNGDAFYALFANEENLCGLLSDRRQHSNNYGLHQDHQSVQQVANHVDRGPDVRNPDQALIVRRWNLGDVCRLNLLV